MYPEQNFLRVTKRLTCAAAFLACLVMVAPTCFGQTISGLIGISPSGSYDSTNFDSVSLTSGNLVLNIPLLSYQQRGSLPPYTVSLNYNNQHWQMRTVDHTIAVPDSVAQTVTEFTYMPPASNSFASGVTLSTSSSVAVGFESLGSCNLTLQLEPQTLPCVLQDYLIWDQIGARHVMQDGISAGGGVSIDGTGLFGGDILTTQGNASVATGYSVTSNGVTYTTPVPGIYPCANSVPCTSPVESDLQNNIIVQAWQPGQTYPYPNTLTDSIGRTWTGPSVILAATPFLLATSSSIPHPLGCYTASYPGVNGTTIPVQFCYGQHTATTAFKQSLCNPCTRGIIGVTEGVATITGIDSILLPDGSS